MWNFIRGIIHHVANGARLVFTRSANRSDGTIITTHVEIGSCPKSEAPEDRTLP